MTSKKREAWNRLEGSRSESPVLLVRVPASLLALLKRKAKTRGLTPSALAREILERSLNRG